MSKKQLHNRLESLFATLEPEDVLAPEPQLAGFISGWTWECDEKGILIACSVEIEDALGYDLSDVIGQPLEKFALAKDSTTALRKILRAKNFPVEITLQYQTREGKALYVRMHISAYPAENGDSGGWHGFVQVIPESSQIQSELAIETETSIEDSREPDPFLIDQKQKEAGLSVAAPTPQISVNLEIPGAADTCWTSAGIQSLIQNQPVLHPGDGIQPAAAAVPFRMNNQPAGVIELMDENPDRKWTEEEQLLIQEVTHQLNLALENAQLYSAVQTELAERVKAEKEILVRERYQKNVAQSVATLSELGTLAIVDVLGQLGMAADADRVVYYDIYVDEHGPYWRKNAEWCKTGIPASPYLDPSYISSFHSQADNLSETGLYAGQVPEMAGPEREMLEGLGIRSFLSIAVQGKNATPGFIRLEELQRSRFWEEEEVQALQLAAAALANTFVREDLLGQLEVSLDETESLYNASRRLAVAGELQTMVAAVLEGLPIPEINRAELLTFNTSVTGSVDQIEVVANWFSGQGIPPALVGSQLSSNLFGSFLQTSQPQYISDIQAQETISGSLRVLFDEQRTTSLAILPLWVGRRQIGTLLLKAEKSHNFTEREIRSYPPLISQMAIAIENLRLFEQTQTALEETESLYQASADLNIARTYAEILEVLRRYTVIGQGAHAVNLSFFNIPWAPERPPEYIEVQARWSDTPNDTFRSRYPLALFSSAFQMLRPDGPIMIEDIAVEPRLDENTRRLYTQSFGATSAIFFPLVVGGQWIGFINSMFREKTAFSEAETRRTMSLTSQAAVAVQNLKNIAATQQRAEEATLLFETSQRLTQARAETEMFQVTLETCKQNLLVNSLTIHLLVNDQGKTQMEQVAHLIDTGMPTPDDGSRFPARLFPYADLLVVGQTAVSPNALQDARLTESARKYVANLDLSSVAAIPLRVRGQTIGVIVAARKHIQTYTPTEITFLESIAVQLSIALDNIRLLHEAQRNALEAQERSEELALVNRVVSSVAASLELRTGLQIVIDELAKTFSLTSGGISLVNEDHSSLTIVADFSPGGESVVGMSLPIEGNPIVQEVFVTRKPVIIRDAQHDPKARGLHEMLTWRGINTIAILPLVIGKDVIGTVDLYHKDPDRSLDESELRLAETIVFQAATAIQNARLFEQSQSALAETELLYRISRSVAQATSPHELLDLVFDTALPEKAERVTFLFLHTSPAGQVLEAEIIASREVMTGYQPESYRISLQALPLIGQLKLEPVLIADTALADLDPASRLTLNQMKVRTACLVPFRSAGHTTGLMIVSSSQAAVYNPKEIRLLQITGDGIAVALEKLRLLQEAQRRALELQTAAEIARDTSGTLDLDSMLNHIVNMLCERFGFYHASIFLLDDTGDNAVIRESTGEAGAEMKQRSYKLPVGSKSIIGAVTETASPVVVNDITTSEIHRPHSLLPGTRSELGIPLKLGDQVIGALDVQSTLINAFHADDIAVLEILADQIAVAIENARAYELSQKAVEEMREVDRVKSQFLANMSHELRTPLNSIIGFSRVILKGIDGPITDIQQQDLTAIYNSGQHLLRLINDILDLSKIEAGKMELAMDDVNIPDLINSVMPTASGLVKDKPIKLVKNVPENLPIVRADPMRIRQILINLLSNAAKFTDEGTITVDSSVQDSPEGIPELVIRVSDTGPGIALEDQKKLFQPFSQVDDSPTRKTGGTGLGLSICRSLVDMHKGRIGLEASDSGKGSTFYFTIPLVKTEIPPADDMTEGPVVLAIDDDLQVISLYERYLKPQGFHVVALSDATQAVQQARQIKPFAITLDVMMPYRDGWHVIQDLKNDPETRDIPVVMCTILEDEEKGFSFGAADYLVKPILQEDLVNSMNRLNADGHIRDVLVIDDDPDDLRLMQKILEQDPNYRVRLARGGAQGWTDITSEIPHIIILDLFMPDLNGFELLEKLRNTPALQDIPVIVLTGADLTPDQHNQLAHLGQDMLAKGLLKENELLNSLDRALKRYKK